MKLRHFFAIAISTYALCALTASAFQNDGVNLDEPAPPATVDLYPAISQVATPEQITTAVIEVQTTTTSTTTTPPALVPADTPCAHLAETAVAGGWPNDPALLVEVLSESWSESRCLPIGPVGHGFDEYSHYFNGSDYGQMQINRAAHYDYVVSLYGSFEAVIDPVTNFNFAWRLYSELEAKGRCGFDPWSRPCR